MLLLANPDAGVVVEFSSGGFDVGGGRAFVEEEAFEDGTTFSVVVVTSLLAPFSADVFVFVTSGMADVVTSLLFRLEVTSSPPAVRRKDETSKITLNILRKG